MPDYRNRAGTGTIQADIMKIGSVQAPRAVLSGAVTFDPPSMTTGGFATSAAIPIVGIALGDSIDLYPPYSTQGIIYQATPSSAGNMIINLFNASAGTLDLVSGSWGYVVKRRT
jgi:hypothetical protein